MIKTEIGTMRLALFPYKRGDNRRKLIICYLGSHNILELMLTFPF